MPREKKGRSPQFASSGERLSIRAALSKLNSLLTRAWKVPQDQFVMVDELAYNLQGYQVNGPEMESGHIDIYVNPASIPWPDKGERSIIPPKNSVQMDEWTDFMITTGYGLDMLRAKPEFFKIPTVSFKTGDGGTISLMRAFEMTNLFIEQTIMHYSLEDVGKDKMKEWISKLSLIEKAALNRGDPKLAKFCQEKLQLSKSKWKDIL